MGVVGGRRLGGVFVTMPLSWAAGAAAGLGLAAPGVVSVDAAFMVGAIVSLAVFAVLVALE